MDSGENGKGLISTIEGRALSPLKTSTCALALSRAIFTRAEDGGGVRSNSVETLIHDSGFGGKHFTAPSSFKAAHADRWKRRKQSHLLALGRMRRSNDDARTDRDSPNISFIMLTVL